MSHRIAVVIGTRPEAIKMAPVVHALQNQGGLEPVVVSTGQHREMLRQMVDVLGIQIDHDLDVMSANQSLAGLSARVLERVDHFLGEEKPALTIVQGDTTTVLMTALACFYRHIPVGHVEAGLRTWNMASPFPEEANRRLATPLADLHFAPTERSRDNLVREGVPTDRIFLTGNTVVDALHREVALQQSEEVRAEVDLELDPLLGDGSPGSWSKQPYVLITGHRRENFGDGFTAICRALRSLSERFPRIRFIYPVHLNPNVRDPVLRELGGLDNVFLLPPQTYRPFVALMRRTLLILTDSGGVQEEAPSLGKPVLVMRDTTERPEGVKAGSVRLVGAVEDSIVEGVAQLLEDARARESMVKGPNPYGDGAAAERIALAVRNHLDPAGAALPRRASEVGAIVPRR